MENIKRVLLLQELIKTGWSFGINEGGKLHAESQQYGGFVFQDEKDFEKWLLLDAEDFV